MSMGPCDVNDCEKSAYAFIGVKNKCISVCNEHFNSKFFNCNTCGEWLTVAVDLSKHYAHTTEKICWECDK